MQRLIRLGFLVAMIAALGFGSVQAQKPQVQVSGKIEPGQVRIFLKDSLYIINKSLVVGGTLIIEPGTEVLFHPNGRLIDSTGGRIIADGNAEALYEPNPTLDGSGVGLDPIQPITDPQGRNPNGLAGYSDLGYFLNNRTSPTDPTARTADEAAIDYSGTMAEPTVHASKQDNIFWVVLDTVNRRVENLHVELDGSYRYYGSNGSLQNLVANQHVVVTYQEALMFIASRMHVDPGTDVNLKNLPWRRVGNKDPNINQATIKFIGQPVNNFSREWGHIIVLPGARAAFFRNVTFEGFKKDTTVDNDIYYNNVGTYNWATINSTPDWDEINNELRKLNNGSGGAITTYSSRTWILGCTFRDNEARFKGGAIQMLEAPAGYPSYYETTLELIEGTQADRRQINPGSPGYKAGVGSYPSAKNPNLTNPDGSPSTFNTNTRIPAIDRIDESVTEPLTDMERAAHDDARLSVFLGRFRNNTFDDNRTLLADVRIERIGNQLVLIDADSASFPYGSDYGNGAFGGAIYVSGADDKTFNEGGITRSIEIGFGVNNSIVTYADAGFTTVDQNITFDEEDAFVATNNKAENRQIAGGSEGARGGAIYIDRYTSLVLAGYHNNNEAHAPHFSSLASGFTPGGYSQGGALYFENSTGRLQLRGGPERDNISNATEFSDNKAGNGGAIYINGNTNKIVSPVIGGTDATLDTRNYGYNLLFTNNTALTRGGAIYTKRNAWINGAGGVANAQLLGYGGKYAVRFTNNYANIAGGALHIDIPNANSLDPNERNVQISRTSFRENTVGSQVTGDSREDIRGGGAIYSLSGDLNVVKATEFIDNVVYNANGGAIAQINPLASSNRLFVTDLDVIQYDNNGVATGYTSSDDVFTWGGNSNYPADVRMMTRFIGNNIIVDQDILDSESGIGTTQEEGSFTNVVRFHLSNPNSLPENGVGLGGALYILDEVSVDRANRVDTVQFNRVRMQNNSSYTGAAVYSDNYNLKMIFNRSLVTGNTATSGIGANQNLITGPVVRDGNGDIDLNHASSDLAGAIIYGEVQGPIPNNIFSEAANSIYDNNARFLIRLPDAPDTKGVLAGQSGIGFGGTDTLRGNYWGRTEANINLDLENLKVNSTQYDFGNANPETFFVAGDGNTWMRFRNSWTTGDDPREQGPFESMDKGYTYEPIPIRNADDDENTVADNSIPENLLMSGHIYDIYDKGTDIKTADYSKRRMAPIEDFAVGIPPVITDFDTPGAPSEGKYVRRWVRDPFCVEDANYNAFINPLQSEYKPDSEGNYYHPIGQPLYLEAMVDYDGLAERSNHDPLTKNETVFFVINETTSDFIRVNLSQVSEDGTNWETFRARVEFVPDSSNRVANSLLRRSAEGLANFGVGQSLLDALANNPYNEDIATLPGRKYSNRSDLLGGSGDLFSNRPSLPDDNASNNNHIATYFAGERYGALPVNVGDDIRVVSRTVLWEEGTVPAFDRGIEFTITNGIEEPQFTGDIVRLQTDTITVIRPAEITADNQAGIPDTLQMVELVNTVFISEDRTYPARDGQYTNLTGDEQGRDSILAITAVDSNNYYDPRALLSSDTFTHLTYWWDVQDNSGLENWIQVDTVYSGNNGVENPKDGAQGYFVFKGHPTNPYVVPGGETVEVRAYSYPPHYRLLDSLKATYGWDNDNDTLAKFIELYPDYFHAQAYDDENARYLQQDTINVGGTAETYRNDYEFTIFVVDSIPSFIEWDSSEEVLTRTDSDGNLVDTIVVYEGSKRACDPTDDDELVANLSGDKLRFQIDINTDDELEDMWAQKVHKWDFRYGRTAYGFVSTHISAGDTVRIDTTVYTDDQGNVTSDITQIRPSWMADEYLYEYDSDENQDSFTEAFTVHGQLNVRIPRAEAIALLTPPVQLNQTLNLDTTMSVVVNDGHGGKTRLNYDIYINVAPEITTETLDNAKEDIRYNPQLLDTLRRINVFDANYNDSHVFELIKADDQRTEIPKDPCFPEAGNWELGVDYFNNTPDWLNINSTSGILYGTPGVEDAPKSDTVSVLVTDEEGLTSVKYFILQVDSTNHMPEITGVPSADCWDLGEPYSDTLTISDIDLDRITAEEVLNIRVVEPNDGSVTVEPSVINGFDTEDSEVTVVVSSSSLNIPLGPDKKGTITIEVTDAAGNVITKTYKIKVSEPVDFVCELTIENNIGSYEVLEWGISHVGTIPTTGDGRDGADIGTLDKEYCEFELAPLPPSDVFDARWTLPSTNGVLRTIYPAGSDNYPDNFLYKAIIQPGGENGNSNIMYPIKITWDRTCVPGTDDSDRNIDGSTWYIRDGFSNGDFFDINMRTGEGRGIESWEVNGDVVTLTLTNTVINSVVILGDLRSDVNDLTTEFGTTISNVTPNPISDDTKIEFTLANTTEVMIEVIDNLGNVVTTIDNRVYTAGNHVVNWDGSTQTGESLSTGAYNIRLVAGGKIATYPIMLVK